MCQAVLAQGVDKFTNVAQVEDEGVSMAQEKAKYRALKPEEIPTKVWNLVIESWENGLSDREAAFRATKYSDIHLTESDIKKWMVDNPDLVKLKDYLHSDLLSSARLNIAREIAKGNTSVSKWYLERKAADEFSTRSAVAFEGAVAELTIEEKQEKLKELMKEFRNG